MIAQSIESILLLCISITSNPHETINFVQSFCVANKRRPSETKTTTAMRKNNAERETVEEFMAKSARVHSYLKQFFREGPRARRELSVDCIIFPLLSLLSTLLPRCLAFFFFPSGFFFAAFQRELFFMLHYESPSSLVCKCAYAVLGRWNGSWVWRVRVKSIESIKSFWR